jgi:hypothetical protein
MTAALAVAALLQALVATALALVALHRTAPPAEPLKILHYQPDDFRWCENCDESFSVVGTQYRVKERTKWESPPKGFVKCRREPGPRAA